MIMSLFGSLFSHGHSYSKTAVEPIPVSEIRSAAVARRSKDGKSWSNAVFTLTSGRKVECKISSESEYSEAADGTELPVSGSVFKLADETGRITDTTYWEE
jgi:hypothetical protein